MPVKPLEVSFKTKRPQFDISLSVSVIPFVTLSAVTVSVTRRDLLGQESGPPDILHFSEKPATKKSIAAGITVLVRRYKDMTDFIAADKVS